MLIKREKLISKIIVNYLSNGRCNECNERDMETLMASSNPRFLSSNDIALRIAENGIGVMYEVRSVEGNPLRFQHKITGEVYNFFFETIIIYDNKVYDPCLGYVGESYENYVKMLETLNNNFELEDSTPYLDILCM